MVSIRYHFQMSSSDTLCLIQWGTEPPSDMIFIWLINCTYFIPNKWVLSLVICFKISLFRDTDMCTKQLQVITCLYTDFTTIRDTLIHVDDYMWNFNHFDMKCWMESQNMFEIQIWCYKNMTVQQNDFISISFSTSNQVPFLSCPEKSRWPIILAVEQHN